MRPTVEEPIRERWTAVQADVLQLRETGKKRDHETAVARLDDFHAWLRELRFLDPACGSGNFLYVTLNLVKNIEVEVIRAREELTGATFTISSLGPMGGITSTPVVNPPQVAIVAVNKIEDKLVPVGGEIEVRKRMNLSLSCDHRVVDGWDAASFMQALKGYIENPLRLLSA